jgi:hypothetical protein
VSIGLEKRADVAPVCLPLLHQRWVAARNIDMLLRFYRATEETSGLIISSVGGGAFGEIPCMCHPVEQVLGSAPSLTGGREFDFGECTHEGRIIYHPSCIIYAFHISFLVYCRKVLRCALFTREP